MSAPGHDTPMTVLPQLERMLVQQAAVLAGAGAEQAPLHVPPAPVERPGTQERARRSRRSGLLALAAALVVGSALGATRPWEPLIGNEHAGHPSVSAAAPSAEALRLLGVLRRPQDPADRDPHAALTLQLLGTGPQLYGIEYRYLRNLAPGAGGPAPMLVPVRSFAPGGSAGTQSAEGGLLCLLYPVTAQEPGAGIECASARDVAQGSVVGVARSEGVNHAYGLVPDGVATVAVTLSGGRQVTAEVHENFFDAPLGAEFVPIDSVRWRDATGAVVGPPHATQARQPRAKGAR